MLTRAGHTEAACDLARLAGLEPAAVIVEIMNEDGSMARRPDLDVFARDHQLKIGTIADLIEYRMLYEQTVDRVGECRLPTPFGEFRMIGYRDMIDGAVHLALVMGDIDSARNRPSSGSMSRTRSAISCTRSAATPGGRSATRWTRVSREGSGVVVVLRGDERPQDLIRSFESMMRFDEGEDTVPRESHEDLRTYGVGARILLDLGVRRMRVLSAPKTDPRPVRFRTGSGRVHRRLSRAEPIPVAVGRDGTGTDRSAGVRKGYAAERIEHGPLRHRRRKNTRSRGRRIGIVAGAFQFPLCRRAARGRSSRTGAARNHRPDGRSRSGRIRDPARGHGASPAPKGMEAVIALGAVVRGETPHFDYVSDACAQGVMRAALDEGVPVIFGVLTTDDDEQAAARTGGAHGNKGSRSRSPSGLANA